MVKVVLRKRIGKNMYASKISFKTDAILSVGWSVSSLGFQMSINEENYHGRQTEWSLPTHWQDFLQFYNTTSLLEHDAQHNSPISRLICLNVRIKYRHVGIILSNGIHVYAHPDHILYCKIFLPHIGNPYVFTKLTRELLNGKAYTSLYNIKQQFCNT